MTPSAAPAVRFTVDPRASQFTVQAFASGLISAVAHSPKIAIREWTGTLSFVPGTLSDAKLKVVAKTGSFEVLDELREMDRRELHRVMYNEVLETKKYPEVVFDSERISVTPMKEMLYRANVEGDLSLHGIRNHHAFFAQVALSDESFRAHGEFTLLQSDYDMRIASIAGGTLKLQDELKFTFYIVGRKQV